jgi:hypothetical protein
MSTTSFSFVQGLADYLAADDLAALDTGDALTLIRAINKALTDWFTLAPSDARRRPFTGGLLVPPQQIEVTATKGSSAITFTDPPPVSAVGGTIIMGGDGAQNRLVSLTQLAMPYNGATGTFNATLYGDAIAMPPGFELLCSDPIIATDAGFNYQLRPYSDVQSVVLPQSWMFPAFLYGSQPTHFRLVPINTLDGSEPLTTLQVWPAPMAAYRLQFDYSGQARPWSIADLSTSRVLDLKDHAWNYIETLTLAHLANSKLLRADIDKKLLLMDAENARKAIEATPVSGTGSGNRIHTPPGF